MRLVIGADTLGVFTQVTLIACLSTGKCWRGSGLNIVSIGYWPIGKNDVLVRERLTWNCLTVIGLRGATDFICTRFCIARYELLAPNLLPGAELWPVTCLCIINIHVCHFTRHGDD